MGSFSLMHWIILGVIVLLLFGKGRISDVMGDVAKGIKSFKKGMADDPADMASTSNPRLNPSPVIDGQTEAAKHDAKA